MDKTPYLHADMSTFNDDLKNNSFFNKA
jgi:hypothetical protein